MHKNQALVLVNYGEATGGEIWDLALKIQTAVKNKYGIVIEPEVNIFNPYIVCDRAHGRYRLSLKYQTFALLLVF